MDFEIKPVSRRILREFSKLFRCICGLSPDEPIDPIMLLDRLPDLEGFTDVRYEIVEDSELPETVQAQCIHLDDGYLIQIKESVYLGAYERRVGGYRMHIVHEIMHVFLDKLGYKPVYSRTFKADLPRYRSLEWAVMALAGELMMPFEATKNMSESDIINIYGVSDMAAHKRRSY